jgi:hypothetical protein
MATVCVAKDVVTPKRHEDSQRTDGQQGVNILHADKEDHAQDRQGDATQTGGQAIDTESRPETKNLSVLMEADDRKQLTCTSMQPLSAQRALNEIVFSCPEFDVQATLIEMRDAGWRLVSVDVGSETSHDGVVEMPLTIQIIKLF